MSRSRLGERRTIPLDPGCVAVGGAAAALAWFVTRVANGEPWTGFLIAAALLGLIPAGIAKSKGRSFLLWWIYGAALFIVALPHALIMKPDSRAIEREELASGDSRKCPFCAEVVKREAVVCRYCGRDLPPQ